MPTVAFYSVLGVSAVDCDSDLALLDLSAPGIEFPFVELADTATVVIGDPVLAIRSPLSLEGSLSEGIISGIRTPASGNEWHFHTTTPVSSGNSGGPLLNMSGQVIGVVSFKNSEGENLIFAVTSDSVIRLLESESESGPTAAVDTCQETELKAGSSDMYPGSIAGSYTGVWQSNGGVSGVALMSLTIDGDIVQGKLTVMGSPLGYDGDDVVGSVTSFSDGIWTVKLKGKKSRMSATAVIQDGNFIGDYTFRYLLFGKDRGQWILQKQQR